MKRTVRPELLDSLPSSSAAARHSRRDLQWFNQLLGNTQWWDRILPEVGGTGRGIEIGAGDGLLARRHGLDGLDLQSAPAGWREDRRWHQSDVTPFDQWADYTLIVSNLFLHHLSEAQLGQLGRIWNHSAKTIVACEPWRARGFRTGFTAMSWLIGAHAVSRHDGRVSVAAGFRGDELPHLLQLDPDVWSWELSHSVRGMYRMVARKEAAA